MRQLGGAFYTYLPVSRACSFLSLFPSVPSRPPRKSSSSSARGHVLLLAAAHDDVEHAAHRGRVLVLAAAHDGVERAARRGHVLLLGLLLVAAHHSTVW